MKLITTLSLLLVFLAPSLLTSCGNSVGLGSETTGNYALTKIKSSNQSLIRSTTKSVFEESGFRMMHGTSSTLSFQKMGNRSAQAAWGHNFNSNPVMIEPEVRISPRGPNTLLLCDVYIVQESTAFGSNVKQPHLVGKAGYERMLSRIRKRVEAAEKANRN